jgi:oligosaccharide repeat unit polymerase
VSHLTLLAAGLWIATAVLVVSMVRKGALRSPVSPLIIFVGLGFLYGVVEPWRNFHDSDLLVGSLDVTPWADLAIFLTALSAFAFTVGARHAYDNPLRPRTYEFRSPSRTARRLKWAVALGSLVTVFSLGTSGLAGRAIFDVFVGEGATVGYVALAPNVVFGASVCLYYVRRTRHDSLASLGGMALSLFVFFASGTRYGFIVGVLAVLSVSCYRKKGRLPQMFSVVPGLVFVGAALGFLGAARSKSASGARSPLDALLSSAGLFKPQAALHGFVDANGYELGSTYLYVIIQAIPSAIWKDRPVTPLQDITSFIYPRAGVAYPVWGEAFVNFGWLGVILLSFAAGWLITRRWDRWLGSKSHGSILDPIAILATLLLVNAISRGYFVQTVFTYGSFLIVPFLVWKASSRRVKSMDTRILGVGG